MHFGSTTAPPYKKLLKTTQNKYEGKSQPYSSVTVLSTGSFTISTGCTSTAFASSAVGAGGGTPNSQKTLEEVGRQSKACHPESFVSHYG